MTPTSFFRLNMYFWLAKTCKLNSSAEGFARIHHVRYRPKTIVVRSTDGERVEAEPQYGCYTFAFRTTAPSPVVMYKNKWAGHWA